MKTMNPEHQSLYLRCQSNSDFYYCCRKLQQANIALPDEITMASIQPLLKMLGLSKDGFTKIDLRDPIWEEIVEPDSDDEDSFGVSPIVADKTFVGTVSFRAECPADVESLFKLLNKKFVGVWDQGANETPDISRGMPDAEVELRIREPLTISKLYGVMKQVEDGHVMVETLRALPLAQNSLIRRDEPSAFDRLLPRDFAADEPDESPR